MPNYTHYVEQFETGDFGAIPTYTLRTRPLAKNVVLNGFRLWLVFVNNPTFTSVTLKIYSDNGGFALKLLHSSTDTYLKADVLGDNSGPKEIFFGFDNVPLNKDTHYHFAVVADGYVGSDSSYVGWRIDPDRVYGGPIASIELLGTCAYTGYAIGDKL